MKWLTAIGMMIAGMYGGQKKKAARRFVMPALPLLVFGKKAWPLLLTIPVICMGYGEDSFLMSWLSADWLVRLVYGALLSLPFFFFGWRKGAIAAVLLPVAFSVRAGSFGYVAWFGDILIEDIIRWGTFGALSVFFLMKSKPQY